MAAIPVTTLNRAGVTDASGTAASAGGDTFVNDGKTLFLVKNGSASPITVSFTIVSAVDGVTPAAKQVTVPATTTSVIGPFPGNVYSDPVTGNVAVAYSAVTTVTVKAMTVGS